MKHIIYVVTEDMDSAVALLELVSQQPGVVRAERTVYEYKKTAPKDWDFSLVNDRFLIQFTGFRGLGEQVKTLLLNTPVIWLDVSHLGDEDIITVVGDLPTQAEVRNLLHTLPVQNMEISTFVAAKRTKNAKLPTPHQP